MERLWESDAGSGDAGKEKAVLLTVASDGALLPVGMVLLFVLVCWPDTGRPDPGASPVHSKEASRKRAQVRTSMAKRICFLPQVHGARMSSCLRQMSRSASSVKRWKRLERRLPFLFRVGRVRRRRVP